MGERNLGATAENPRIAERAALMTRAAKRDVDRDALRGVWEKQAADLGLFERPPLPLQRSTTLPGH